MPGGGGFYQGDIILIDFPYSNLQNSKKRPAVVISNKIVNRTSDIICAQITSQVYRDEFSFEIKASDVTVDLRGYSEVRCHKIFTLEKSTNPQKISKLHKQSEERLLQKIKTLF